MSYLSMALFILVLVSAYAVVTVRHENRLAFSHMQTLESQRSELQSQWSRLMLERATWSSREILSQQSIERLDMVAPSPDDIVTVRRQVD